MRSNPIQSKSYNFANRIIKLSQFLYSSNEFILSKQILKSGTSIGANIEEALGGQTKKDFFSKLSISYKECRETRYWLLLLKDNNYISTPIYQSLYHDLLEIIKLIVSIQKTIKTKSTVI